MRAFTEYSLKGSRKQLLIYLGLPFTYYLQFSLDFQNFSMLLCGTDITDDALINVLNHIVNLHLIIVYS